MLILPAIDIDGGQVARGSRGASGDPFEEACALRDAGVRWIHVVDMDRAFGSGDNTALVRQIAGLESVHVQLGGALTEPKAVTEAIGWGVKRVVVGSLAVAAGLAELSGCPRQALAGGIDVRDGRVFTRSTEQYLEHTPGDLLDRAVAAGVRTVVYRDVDRDGGLDGADIEGARRLVGRGADVILAGGIASVDEIQEAVASGFSGVIVGRAMHEGRFTLDQAMACSA